MVFSSSWADDGAGFSGKVSEEAGFFQSSGSFEPYQYSRLLLRSHDDLLDSLSLVLEGEINQQSSASALAPSWPLYPTRNFLDLEAEDLNSSQGTSFLSARFSRAFLKWTSGPLELTAGLQNFNWGASSFYRPTDYFYPLSPLAWVRDEPLGSEGLDASYFLFDNFSLEGAVRWLSGRTSEGVIRLVNKEIGLSVTPSLALLQGRSGLGLELSGTFPDFQLRLEGVDWLENGETDQVEWIAGFSTLVSGTKLNLEVFQDSTGMVLGSDSSGTSNAAYLFASVEKTFTGQWKAAPALVKSLGGGPLLFWPKVSWGFAPSLELSLQAQVPLGAGDGLLALNPGRTGLSAAYSF